MRENQGEKRISPDFSRLSTRFPLFALVLGVYAAFLALVYGPSSLSLALGCRWDCGWYQSILRNGYVSVIPPTPQDLDHSNVAFFPLFPLFGRFLSTVFGLSGEIALPLVSIFFAFGIFKLLPTLASRGRVLFLVAFPATFYFFVGYSESVYCFWLFFGLFFLFRRNSISTPVLFGGIFLSGLALGLTRLTGFVIPGGALGMLVMGRVFRKIELDRRLLSLAAVWAIGSVLGAGSFFLYSELRFGVWDLYFQTLNAGWKKEISFSGFLGLFARAIPKNIFPPIFARDPTRFSWIVNADTIVVYSYVLVLEGRALFSELKLRFSPERSLRFALLAAGLVHVLITTLGDSGSEHRWGNGMRYTMPALYLLVFLWDREWTPRWLLVRPKIRRFAYLAALVFGFGFQLYYLYLFTKWTWVS